MMDLVILETERLRLVAANAALARLELENRPKLFAVLDVAPPPIGLRR